MNILILILSHIMYGAILAVIAVKWKRRSAFPWFIIGFLTAIVGLIVLAFMPKMPLKENSSASEGA